VQVLKPYPVFAELYAFEIAEPFAEPFVFEAAFVRDSSHIFAELYVFEVAEPPDEIYVPQLHYIRDTSIIVVELYVYASFELRGGALVGWSC